jgi:hypothetical protein
MTRPLRVLPLAAGLGLAACQSLALDLVPGVDARADAPARPLDAAPPLDAGVRHDAKAPPDAQRDATMVHEGSADAPSTDAGPRLDASTFVCAPASQTTFGPLLVGDVNPAYTSGVAARAASRVYLFDSVSVDAGGQIFVQPFDLSTDAGPSQGTSTLLYTPDAGPDLYLHDVAVAPSGDIVLLYGSGQWRQDRRPNVTTEGPLYALFLQQGAPGGSLSVLSNVSLDPSTGVYGQAHATWDDGAGAFHISWERRSTYVGDAGEYSIAVSSFTASGGATGTGYGRVPVTNDGKFVLAAGTEQGSVGAAFGVLGVAYVTLLGGGTPSLALLTGSPVSDTIIQAGPDGADPPFVATAGTSAGLVYVAYQYNEPELTTSLVTIQEAGTGVATPGAYLGTPQTIVNARVVNDNAGGGVGVVVEYPAAIGFAYVSPDAMLVLAGDAGILRAPDAGVTDQISIGSFRGSFVVALFNSMSHQTIAAVSGCTSP